MVPKIPSGAKADVGDSVRDWTKITDYVMKKCAEKIGKDVVRQIRSDVPRLSVFGYVILVQMLVFVYSFSDLFGMAG